MPPSIARTLILLTSFFAALCVAQKDGRNSLTFVFDSTGSMDDDLDAVMSGIRRIAASYSNIEQIRNYILIKVHDPDVSEPLITTRITRFYRFLTDIYVQGGGDCPEMTVTGIEKALLSSLPHSSIFVFTDGSAKDFKKTDAVLNLIQKTQSQVTFVMTGDCGNRSSPEFQAFLKISSMSSGQVFHIKKKDVKEFLKIIELVIQTRKVNILVRDAETNGSAIYNPPVDNTLKRLVVSVVAPDSNTPVQVNIRDKNGKLLKKGIGVKEEMQDVASTYFGTVKNPSPGPWSIEVLSSGKHTIRVTGQSPLDFLHGFHTGKVLDIGDAYKRPLKGVLSYIYINMTAPLTTGSVSRVDLLTINGTKLGTLPVKRSTKKPDFYVSQIPFKPPSEQFFIKVTGKDNKGETFQRYTPTGISSRDPAPPMVTCKQKQKAKRGENYKIQCEVKSDITYSVQWFRNAKPIGPPQYAIKKSGPVYHTIDKANEDLEGVYTCNASNSAGSGVDHVTFQVLPPPPNIITSKNVTAAPGGRVEFTCTVYSQNKDRTNVRWFQIYKGLPLESTRRKRISMQQSRDAIVSKLVIPKATRGDEGAYLCEASHEGGNTTKKMFLKIQSKPQIRLEEDKKTFKTGDKIELFCRADGIPQPKISWEFRGSKVLPNSRIQISRNRLLITEAQFSDTGDYVCVATSKAGVARKNVTVTYTESPMVEIQEKEVQAVLNQPTSIKCVARGIPKPIIRWEKNGQTLKQSTPEYSYDDMGTLTIKRVSLDMDGQWTCVAQNAAGTSVDVVELNVGTPPVIGDIRTPVNVTYGANVTLRCNVKGSPKPKVEWLKGRRPSFRPLPFERKYELRRDNSLVIKDVKLTDKGFYTCMARNPISADSKSVQIIVTGMKAPVLAHIKSNQVALEGDRKRIKCRVSDSKPEPTIIWMKDGKELKSDGRILVNQGNLLFTAVKGEDEGEYVCIAKNEVGSAQWKIRLNIQTRPIIIGKKKETIKTIQGKKLTLRCRAKGDPEPSYDWTKDGGPINYADTAYNLLEDSSLEIYSITKAHQGFYMCTAKNKNAMDTKEIKVTVLTPPRINRDGGDTLEVKVGKSVVLPCRIIEGYPIPDVAWYRGSKKLKPVSGRIVISSARTLEIFRVEKDDAGQYECRATNNAGSDSRMFNLDVILPPQPRNLSKDQRMVVKGQDITLRCLVSGYPPPQIMWYFDNKPLLEKELSKFNARIDYDDQSLTIKNAGLNHEGEFKCVATNRGGTTEIKVRVVVTVPPLINKNLPNTTASQEGSPVILACPATGNPTPNITWYFNNKEIPKKGRGRRYTVEGSLVIDAVKYSHAGDYKCIAKNKAGSDSRISRLFVIYDVAAENATSPETKSEKGANITFECVVKSNPPPEIRWQKNGVPIFQALPRQRYILDKNASSLTILNVAAEDEGQYSCVVVNIPGKQIRQVFNLTVEVSPAILRFKSSPRRIAIREGETVKLKCAATAMPKPKMRWFKSNRLIMPTDGDISLRTKNRELIISSAQASHAGLYVCEAYNRIGKDSHKILLVVTVPPKIKDADKLERPRLIVGKEAKLRCEVLKGAPIPDILWRVDQTKAIPGSQYMMDDLNQVLLIKKVDMTHGTRISCKAENSVGSAVKYFDPILLSPPLISKTSDAQQVVVEKRNIILSCYIERGSPRPNITWYRDGEKLRKGLFSNIKLRSQGTQLHLKDAKRTDAARYKCIAENEAGKDEMTYTLEVQVPAYIELSSPDKTPEVVLGRSFSVFCIPKGRPEPSIKWLKDNQPIKSSRIKLRNGDKELIINKTQEADAGRYTCRASNTIGMDSENFDVSITYAPRLEVGGKRQYLWKSQTGSTVTLECPVTGNPKPKLEWLKNGNPLVTNGRIRYRNSKRQVVILMLAIQDQAKYTCVAENSIGTLEITNIVDVGRPPTIESNQLQLEFKIQQGKTLVISCPATGTPRPKVIFQHGGKGVGIRPGVIVSQTEQTLRILSVKKSHAGIYRCIAENSAGRTAVDFKVSVMIPPAIDPSNLVPNLRWLVGQSRTLECPLTGQADPPASISWERDERPLMDGPGIQLSPDRRRVSIASVTLADSGSYTCIASNEVANVKQVFKVTVMMKPKFDDDSMKFVHVVIQNSSVLIDCVARAVPEPTYDWERGGRFITNNNLNSDKIRIINNGRRLEILNAQDYDAANYSCTAYNNAGHATRDFVVKVIVPPVIERSRQSPIIVDVQENKPTRLNCSVVGGITGDIQITWYKDGSPILVSAAAEIYRVVDSGRGLVILAPSSQDTGRYKCRASNKAGFDNLVYKVNVIVPPSFPADFSRSRQDIEARVNEPVTLTCPATGSPDPIITWYKDGRHTDGATQYVRIHDNGKVFELVSALSKDKGRYHCTAVNQGGQVRKDYTLMVMEPPTVRIPYERREPREGSHYFEIRCYARGDPKPTITWLKDGARLRPSSRVSFTNDGILIIRAVRGDDSGRYTCTATNRLSKASKSLIVNVLRAPKVIAPKRFVKAILGERAILPCQAEGSPKPKISWEHNSYPVDGGTPGFSLTDTSLTVLSVEERHAGRYTCIAKSNAGADLATITLEVVVPPTIISTSPSNVKQFADNELSLQCNVRGDPPPKLWWEINGQRITRDDLRYRVLSTYLIIHRVTEDDIGQFVCVAENEAGRTTHSFNVQVLVKPEARIKRKMYTYNLGETAQIECKVDGRPKPSILWTKDGRNVRTASRRYTVLQERILRISDIKEKDEGTFRCQAENEAGLAHAGTMLRIRTPPKFREVPPEAIDVNENGFKDLVCIAEGRPPPRIEFYHNGTRLVHNPSSGGWGRYTIRDARQSSAGMYTCSARNPAGRKVHQMRVRIVGRPRVYVIQSDQAVVEKREAILRCEVKGENYKIVWMKDDEEIVNNTRLVKLENGSLSIKDAKLADAGTYRCLAANEAGQDEGKVILNIESAPKISLGPQNTTTNRGKTVLIPCKAESFPRPTTRWYKDMKDLSLTNRHTVLANGSLMIVGTSITDSGVYQCVAENKHGEAHSKKAELRVVVHGGWGPWTGWSRCSLSCGPGKKMRSRQCNNPAPQHGGKLCQGKGKETIPCLVSFCPVNGGWGQWSEWDHCSSTCGSGMRTRNRRCDNPPPENGGRGCSGDAVESAACHSEPCPVNGRWGPWTPWSRCSVTCGQGKTSRRRTCDNPEPKHGGRKCHGSSSQTRTCNRPDCPVNGKWGEWKPWTECSQSCGGGFRRRERLCNRPSPSTTGRYCEGDRSQIEACNQNVRCPVDGGWSWWSAWSSCSQSCGNSGQMIRTRNCSNPSPQYNGQPCEGESQETRPCNRRICPTGVFTQWSMWSPCTESCGGGKSYRTRECMGPQKCEGETKQTRTCNSFICTTTAPAKAPTNALGRITGFINNYPVGVVLVNGDWDHSSTRKRVDFKVRFDRVPDVLSGCFQAMSGALSPLLWLGAYEVDGASNGYTVSGGNFRRDSEVHFASGAVLKMTHHVRNTDGQTSFNTIVRGSCPQHIRGPVKLVNYVEKYVQMKPQAIYAHSSNVYQIENSNHPYAWNHTITYSTGRQQKFITQKMVVESISVDYDRPIRRINFKLSAIMAGEGNICPDGFKIVNDKYCEDKDECLSGEHKCEHKCFNQPGGYRCSCKLGFKLGADGRSCKDDNECLRDTHNCNRRNQQCINTLGSFKCIFKCGAGLRSLSNGQCTDIDECTENKGICGGRLCKNTYGSYRCLCKLGFRQVGTRCEDINECKAEHPCSDLCINVPGSFRCGCTKGFKLVGLYRCVDVDECFEGTHNCPKGSACVNTRGSFKCESRCPRGFQFSETERCVDVDECKVGTHRCQGNSKCVNTIGSYRCDCPPGYRKINGVCRDIDECMFEPKPCPYKCKNVEGDYECICPRGSERLPDKKSCVGVGGSKCRPGFQFIFGQGCMDIDECRKNTTCQYKCINQPGTYRCICPKGYDLTRKGTCRDVNECVINRQICNGGKLCLNARGSYHCLPVKCPSGYTFNPYRKVCTILCSKSNLTCPLGSRIAESIIFSSVSFPSKRGYSAARIRVRNAKGQVMRHCKFTMLDKTPNMPFAFKQVDGSGLIHTTKPTKTTKNLYFMRIRASCYITKTRNKLVYQNSFFVYISVSRYPF